MLIIYIISIFVVHILSALGSAFLAAKADSKFSLSAIEIVGLDVLLSLFIAISFVGSCALIESFLKLN